jgi:hypothetical protein
MRSPKEANKHNRLFPKGAGGERDTHTISSSERANTGGYAKTQHGIIAICAANCNLVYVTFSPV